MVNQSKDSIRVEIFVFLGNPDVHLAVLFSKIWAFLLRFSVPPPHILMRYVSLLNTKPLAKVFLQLFGSIFPMLFSIPRFFLTDGRRAFPAVSRCPFQVRSFCTVAPRILQNFLSLMIWGCSFLSRTSSSGGDPGVLHIFCLIIHSDDMVLSMFITNWFVYCIMCMIYCALYTIYCILYTIYYILYTIYYILYTIYYILYTIYYILYTIYYILYTIYYILYTIYYILYTIYYILYTIYYILYTIYYILYTIYYILYTIYYILYTIYYILYTVYCILYI